MDLDPRRDPQAVRAAVDAAARLVDEGELDAALAAYDRVLDALADLPPVPDDPVLRESRFAARFERAGLLVATGELAAAADGFAAAGAGLDPADPDQHHERAMAGLNEGVARGMAGDAAGAVAAYRRALDDLPDDPGRLDVPTLEQSVMLRVNLADAHLDAGDVEAAGAAAGAVLRLLDTVGASLGEDVAAEQRALAHAVADEAHRRRHRAS
ncbi:MAG: hypothetical protein ACLGIR_04765 [Actinomycetes bacterium]